MTIFMGGKDINNLGSLGSINFIMTNKISYFFGIDSKGRMQFGTQSRCSVLPKTCLLFSPLPSDWNPQLLPMATSDCLICRFFLVTCIDSFP